MGGAIIVGLIVGWASGGREKAQGIRALDVFVIGPLMISVAASATPDPTARLVLAFMGAATMSFNGHNFLTEN